MEPPRKAKPRRNHLEKELNVAQGLENHKPDEIRRRVSRDDVAAGRIAGGRPWGDLRRSNSARRRRRRPRRGGDRELDPPHLLASHDGHLYAVRRPARGRRRRRWRRHRRKEREGVWKSCRVESVEWRRRRRARRAGRRVSDGSLARPVQTGTVRWKATPVQETGPFPLFSSLFLCPPVLSLTVLYSLTYPRSISALLFWVFSIF